MILTLTISLWLGLTLILLRRWSLWRERDEIIRRRLRSPNAPR
jgi:hypothetical protein